MNLVSFPAPNVTWIRMTKFKWTVRIDKFNYRHKISSTIQIKSESEFGKHGIKICNTLGCIVENITFIPEGNFYVYVTIQIYIYIYRESLLIIQHEQAATNADN